jgi:hypothetical protein
VAASPPPVVVPPLVPAPEPDGLGVAVADGDAEVLGDGLDVAEPVAFTAIAVVSFDASSSRLGYWGFSTARTLPRAPGTTRSIRTVNSWVTESPGPKSVLAMSQV